MDRVRRDLYEGNIIDKPLKFEVEVVGIYDISSRSSLSYLKNVSDLTGIDYVLDAVQLVSYNFIWN